MPGQMSDEDREKYQEQKARTRAAIASDPDVHRELYRDAHKRALYAHMAAILERSCVDENPTLGLLGIEFMEDGRFRWVSAGGTPPIIALQALEMLRVSVTIRAMNEHPEQFGLRKPPFADEGMDGDQVVVDEDGSAEIKCGIDDAMEADREKAENAWRLARALCTALSSFYGTHLGVEVVNSLRFINDVAESRLELLAPAAFYKE